MQRPINISSVRPAQTNRKMARYADQSNPETMLRWMREGRGQGEGPDYRPWLTVRDVPSRGLSTRIKGWKTRRVQHLLSLQELRYFFCLEWAEEVLDIREQFPLTPLSETLEIAKECGVRHPGMRGGGAPVMMTSDFLIKVCRNASKVVARTFKLAKDLNQRTIEKFEIERLYWLRRSINWAIVTEQDVPLALANNVAAIHEFRNLDAHSLKHDQIVRIGNVLQDRFLKGGTEKAGEITRDVDLRLGLSAGTSWIVFKHLLANRVCLIDMHQPLRADRPLNLLKFNPLFLSIDNKEAA